MHVFILMGGECKGQPWRHSEAIISLLCFLLFSEIESPIGLELAKQTRLAS